MTAVPTDELLPCPFCGGNARIVEGEESAYVQCDAMKMHRALWFDGDNDAANEVREQWNRRTPPASAKNATGIEPVAFIQLDVLKVLAEDKTATGTVCSGLLRKAFGDPVPLYSSTQLAEITRQRDEALAKVVELGRDLSNARWEEHHQWKRAEASGAVQVKPLEWRLVPVPPMGEWLASSPVGLYCIPIGSGKFPLRFRDKETIGTFYTLAEAKAAAQADFDQRIRSALAEPTLAPCPSCEGKGYYLHGSAGEVNCPRCNGTGLAASPQAPGVEVTEVEK